ncbi:MAG: hypothetical protein PVF83_05000 [Anaerolineales bacterium]|jgi:hypothetical protein
MNKRILFLIISIFLLASCTQSQGALDTSNDQPQPETQAVEVDETVVPIETSGPDCLGPETHAVGQAIADQFEEADYEDVMTWFCNGAEFEDILVALQTEKDTGESAEDLLQLLADGQTWEEIWESIGYTD